MTAPAAPRRDHHITLSPIQPSFEFVVRAHVRVHGLFFILQALEFGSS